jgi:uncharacterized membrane protein
MFIIHGASILINLGYNINLILIMALAIGIFFFYLGILLEKTKRNWFIGIRTPWTISSDYVWDKTNKLGGKLFKICGVICIVGVFFGNLAIWFILVPIIFSAVFLIFYSYIQFRGLHKKS